MVSPACASPAGRSATQGARSSSVPTRMSATCVFVCWYVGCLRFMHAPHLSEVPHQSEAPHLSKAPYLENWLHAVTREVGKDGWRSAVPFIQASCSQAFEIEPPACVKHNHQYCCLQMCLEFLWEDEWEGAGLMTWASTNSNGSTLSPLCTPAACRCA
eukprot:78251-Pelagomonas_calceolata.AAC.1